MVPADEYLRFIWHIEALIQHGIAKLETTMQDQEMLAQSASAVLERLKSPSATVIFANAFSQLEPEVEQALLTEISFITSNLGRVFRENEDPDYEFLQPVVTPDEHDRDLASAAKTGKESLEKILKKWLPDWVKTRLTILNEILSIVFKL